MYGIPATAFLLGYGYAAASGLPEIHQAAYLAASLCCVGALAGLSSQASSRWGNNLGMVSPIAFENDYRVTKIFIVNFSNLDVKEPEKKWFIVSVP